MWLYESLQKPFIGKIAKHTGQSTHFIAAWQTCGSTAPKLHPQHDTHFDSKTVITTPLVTSQNAAPRKKQSMFVQSVASFSELDKSRSGLYHGWGHRWVSATCSWYSEKSTSCSGISWQPQNLRGVSLWLVIKKLLNC